MACLFSLWVVFLLGWMSPLVFSGIPEDPRYPNVPGLQRNNSEECPRADSRTEICTYCARKIEEVIYHPRLNEQRVYQTLFSLNNPSERAGFGSYPQKFADLVIEILEAIDELVTKYLNSPKLKRINDILGNPPVGQADVNGWYPRFCRAFHVYFPEDANEWLEGEEHYTIHKILEGGVRDFQLDYIKPIADHRDFCCEAILRSVYHNFTHGNLEDSQSVKDKWNFRAFNTCVEIGLNGNWPFRFSREEFDFELNKAHQLANTLLLGMMMKSLFFEYLYQEKLEINYGVSEKETNGWNGEKSLVAPLSQLYAICGDPYNIDYRSLQTHLRALENEATEGSQWLLPEYKRIINRMKDKPFNKLFPGKVIKSVSEKCSALVDLYTLDETGYNLAMVYNRRRDNITEKYEANLTEVYKQNFHVMRLEDLLSNCSVDYLYNYDNAKDPDKFSQVTPCPKGKFNVTLLEEERRHVCETDDRIYCDDKWVWNLTNPFHLMRLAWEKVDELLEEVKCYRNRTYYFHLRDRAIKATQRNLKNSTLFTGISTTLGRPCTKTDADIVGECTKENNEICAPMHLGKVNPDSELDGGLSILRPKWVFWPVKEGDHFKCYGRKDYIIKINVCRCGFRLDCGEALGTNIVCQLQRTDPLTGNCRGSVAYPCATLPLAPGRHNQSCITDYCDMQNNSCEEFPLKGKAKRG